MLRINAPVLNGSAVCTGTVEGDRQACVRAGGGHASHFILAEAPAQVLSCHWPSTNQIGLEHFREELCGMFPPVLCTVALLIHYSESHCYLVPVCMAHVYLQAMVKLN